jgi:hypothetical protein
VVATEHACSVCVDFYHREIAGWFVTGGWKGSNSRNNILTRVRQWFIMLDSIHRGFGFGKVAYVSPSSFCCFTGSFIWIVSVLADGSYLCALFCWSLPLARLIKTQVSLICSKGWGT